jgi:hypothetical protein
MLAAFVDELTKMSEGNYASPMSTGKGSNIMAQPAYQKSGLGESSNPAVKSTNYSIVHSNTPTAAETLAPAQTKAVPPPPVRT